MIKFLMWILASHVWIRNERRQVLIHQINRHQPQWNRRNLVSNLRFPKPCFTTVQWGILCTYPLTALLLRNALQVLTPRMSPWHDFLSHSFRNDPYAEMPSEIDTSVRPAPWGLPYERVGDFRRKIWIRPGSNAVRHMSRMECKWEKPFVLPH